MKLVLAVYNFLVVLGQFVTLSDKETASEDIPICLYYTSPQKNRGLCLVVNIAVICPPSPVKMSVATGCKFTKLDWNEIDS